MSSGDLIAPGLENIEPVTLTRERVLLEPLDVGHAPGLYEFGRDPDLWTWMPRGPFTSVADAEDFIAQALEEQQRGRGVPYAVRRRQEQDVIGHMRYLDPQPLHGSVEIGWVMIAREHQRSMLAIEANLLLYDHAFVDLGATRVWMKTDARNKPARLTMEAGGLVYEGTLRKHGHVSNGYIRDSAIYSLIAEEWPERKRRVLELLGEAG